MTTETVEARADMAVEISDTAVYVAAATIAAPKVFELLSSLFKGSISRNIEQADKAQEKAESEIEELKDKVVNLDRTVAALQSDHVSHKQSMTTALGSIDGRLQALDNRIAGQGKAYEDKITEGFKRLEIELNRKLAQVLSERRRSR